MNQTNTFSISRKLVLGFVAPILLATVMGISFIVSNLVGAEQQSDLRTSVEALDTARQMNIEILNARRREKDFLLFYKEEDFDTAYESYVVTNQAHTQNVRDLMDELAGLGEQGDNTAIITSYVSNAADITIAYDALFVDVVEGIRTRGYIDTGLEGNLRAIAAQLEDEFETSNDDHLMVAFLTLRRREKDYLLRADQTYVTETQTAIDELRTQIMISETLSEGKKRSLNQLIDNYSTAFSALVGADSEINANLELLREKGRELQPIIDEIVQIEVENEQAARSQTESLRRVSQIVTVVVLASVILVSSLLAYRIGRSIVQPLNKITEAAREITAGDLNRTIDVTSKDEIGQLAATLNQMTSEVQQYVNRETHARQTLEDAVTEYVQFVEGVAQGQLSERLPIARNANHDEPLTRLGVNLNTMVDGLTELTRRIEESTEKEREARYHLQETVDEYVAFVEQVSQGNLANRIALNGNGHSKEHEDQLIKLGDNLNHMVSSLYEMAGQTREVSFKISSATSEILAATTQQLSAATEQDTTINQTSTTATEVLATVTQTAERAENVARVAQRSVEVSQQGQQVIRDSVEGMNMIRHQVEGIAENILALSEKTQQIGNIIASVNDIAEQSKVLALNASIEAARAGEEGKSFAVVAMEVRNLAEQSREATDQVREILNEIQQATNTAVMATEEGIKGVDVGQGLINKAGDTIQDLASVIREAAQAASQIAASTHQQTVGMDQLSAAMHAIRQSSIQTTASVQQAERSAQDLNIMARQMQEAVSLYSL
jgi:methyl-accepting chemotaxis protein